MKRRWYAAAGVVIGVSVGVPLSILIYDVGVRIYFQQRNQYLGEVATTVANESRNFTPEDYVESDVNHTEFEIGPRLRGCVISCTFLFISAIITSFLGWVLMLVLPLLGLHPSYLTSFISVAIIYTGVIAMFALVDVATTILKKVRN